MHFSKKAFCGPIHAIECIPISNSCHVVFYGKGPLLCCFDGCSKSIILEHHFFNHSKVQHGNAFEVLAIKQVFLKHHEEYFELLLCLHGHRQVLFISLHLFVQNNFCQRIQVQNVQILPPFWDWILTCAIFSPSLSQPSLFYDYDLLIGFAHNCVAHYQITFSNNTFAPIVTLQRKQFGTPHCLLYAMQFYGSKLTDVQVACGTIFHSIAIWKPFSENSNSILLTGHQGVIFHVEWSHNGNYLLSTSDDRSIRLWNLQTKQIETICYGHYHRVWQSKFLESNSVEKWISCGEDDRIKIWNQEKCVDTFLGNVGNKSIWCIAMFHSSQIYGGCQDGTIQLFSLAPNDEKYQFETESIHLLSDKCVQYIPTLQQFISQTNQQLFILQNNTLSNISIPISNITFFATIPQQQFICFANVHGDAIFVNIVEKTIQTINISVENQKLFSLFCGGHYFLIGYHNRLIALYNFQTNQMIKQFKLSSARLTSALIIDENEYYMGFENGNLYSTVKQVSKSVYSNHGKISSIVKWQSYLVTSNYQDAIIDFWHMPLLSHSIKLQHVMHQIDSLHVTQQNQMIALGFWKQELIVFQIDEERILFKLSIFPQKKSLYYCWHNSYLYITFQGKLYTVSLQKTDSKRMIGIPCHGKEIYQVKWIDKNHLITCSEDTTALLYSYQSSSLQFLSTLQGIHQAAIKCATSVEMDSNFFIFLAGGKEQVSIWNKSKSNTVTCEKQIFLQNELADVQCRILSIDAIVGNHSIQIACGSSDGHVKCYRYDKQQWSFIASTIYKQPIGPIFHVKWISPNMLLFVSSNGQWQLAQLIQNELQVKQTVTVHQSVCVNSLYCLLVEDIIYIASGADDHSIAIGKLSLQNNTMEWTQTIHNKHQASVNGIALVCVKQRLILCSASRDHCIHIWEKTNDTNQFIYANSLYHEVSDLENMDAKYVSEENVILLALVGAGLQIISCSV